VKREIVRFNCGYLLDSILVFNLIGTFGVGTSGVGVNSCLSLGKFTKMNVDCDSNSIQTNVL